MTRVILTSFEPFGGHAVNSSLEVGRLLARRPPPGVELEWLVLPVVAGDCVRRTWEAVEAIGPGLVLCLGQAAGAAALRIEGRAVNVNDFAIADNAGNRLRGGPVVADAPAAYRTDLPVGIIRQEVSRGGVPAELSASAGTSVCNPLFYGLLPRAAAGQHPHRTGFLHLPLLPGQVKPSDPQPSLPLEQMAEGVRRAVSVMIETRAF